MSLSLENTSYGHSPSRSLATKILDLERQILEQKVGHLTFKEADISDDTNTRHIAGDIYLMLDKLEPIETLKFAADPFENGQVRSINKEELYEGHNKSPLAIIIKEIKKIAKINLIPRYTEIVNVTLLNPELAQLITQYDSVAEHIIKTTPRHTEIENSPLLISDFAPLITKYDSVVECIDLFLLSKMNGNELREIVKSSNKSLRSLPLNLLKAHPGLRNTVRVTFSFLYSITQESYINNKYNPELLYIFITSADYFKLFLFYIFSSNHYDSPFDSWIETYLEIHSTKDLKHLLLIDSSQMDDMTRRDVNADIREVMSREFPKLKSISMENLIHMEDLSLTAICNAKLHHLSYLSLHNSSITDVGIQELCRNSPICKSLQHLSVAKTGVSSEGVRAIASSMHNLRKLYIDGTQINDDDIAYIAQSETMSNLTEFGFKNYNITVVALRAIFASQKMKNLVRIVSDVELPDDLRAYIKETFHFKKLRYFNDEILEHFFHEISQLQKHVQKLQAKTMKISREVNRCNENLSHSLTRIKSSK